MRKYLNGTNVPLSVAVFLADDNYDYEPNTISATGLIRPIRQIILAKRVPAEQALVDISGLLKSRMGTALHDAIERAWKNNRERSMTALGYPEQVIKRVRVNPDPKTVKEDEIPVYLEIRSYREVLGHRVSGKFDFVAEGRVEDFKSTSVFIYSSGNKEKDYKLQGSIYRWLNPEIITADEMAINFILTDYMPARAGTDPNYPTSPTPQKLIPLMSLDETERFVRNKLIQIQQLQDRPEEELPKCTDEELWRKAPTWKYYANPAKMGRATKNFDNAAEAAARKAKDGNKGVIVEEGGEVMACKYCPAFPVCSQKDDLIAEGSLKL